MVKLDVLKPPPPPVGPENHLNVDSGTRITFMQTAAPVGWTKDVTHDNKALRVVSGSTSSGGTQAFSTVFGAGKTTQSHTLTTPQMASHTHGYVGPNMRDNRNSSTPKTLGGRTTVQTGPKGSNQSHAHNIDIDIQYVDVIIAAKD